MSDTKNIKGNRKVVVAQYTVNRLYKIPDGLDLEDKTVVKRYAVEFGHLCIFYTDGREEEIYRSHDEGDDCREPDETSIEDAEDHDIYYTADEESDEEED